MNNSYKDDLIGAKGGGSTFRNRPDNLRSTDTFEALLGLCTGRIKGLAPGGLKNLMADDVPIEDGAGNKTLGDFTAVLFDGDPAVLQPVQLQLGGSSGANSVNLAVDNDNAGATTEAGPPGEWRFGTVTQVGVDYIDIRFLVNALYKQDKNGIYDTTASIEIQLQPSGSSTWVNPLLNISAPTYNSEGISLASKTGMTVYAMRDKWLADNPNEWADAAPGYLQITGKTTQAYVKELRIAVPNTGAYANKTWQVRCRLMERDSYTNDTDEERRTIIWESVAGVSMAPFGDTEEWRGLAYLQINGKASDQLTGIPTITGIYDLSVVRVPPASVWDAETREYTGATWDGATEEIQWTQCPAFQIKDLIEDGVSGISALVPGSTLNKWDALEASKWYAQQVPDGKGGTHCRYSMNYMLDNALSVNDLMQYTAGAVGSYAWDEGDGNWRLIVEKPENPTALFTKENIIGDFNYSHTDIDSRYNDIVGVFRNEDKGFAEDRVRVFDQPHIDTFGRRATSLALVGCTNRQEALRRIKLRQITSLKETRQTTFVTNRQGNLVQPFSVILVADGDLGASDERTTGRLTKIEGTTVYVRDRVRLELGISYKLRVTVPNPNYDPDALTEPTDPDWKKPTITITRNITNTSTQRGDVLALHLDSALPDNTPENAPIAFEAVGLPTMPKQYRVLDVEPQDEEMIAISAVEIYTAKWDESDNVNEGEVLGQLPNKTVPPPYNMQFGLKSFESEYQTKRVISAVWSRPVTKWFDGFKIEYTFNGGQPITLNPKTQDSFAELQEVQDGVYEFRIYTLDKRGGVSLPLVGAYILGEVPPAGSSRMNVSTNTASIVADSSGTVIDGQLPFLGWARYFAGDANVSTTAAWSISTSGCTASIDTDGTWEITAVSTSGYVDITGTFMGTALTQRITVLKNVQGGSSGSTVTISSFSNVSSTTYPSSPSVTAVVTSSAAGKLNFSGYLNYDVAGTTAFKSINLAGKIAYRVSGSGSGWTDVAAETDGSPATSSGDKFEPEYESGYLELPSTLVTGLTASTAYEFGVFLRKSGGTSSSTTPYGAINAEPIT